MKTEQYNEHAGIKNSKNMKVNLNLTMIVFYYFLLATSLLNAKNIDI